MPDDKICPIMSRGTFCDDGDHLLATIYCQRERCMAWVPDCEEVGRNSCCQVIEECFKEKSQPQRDNCFGYCKLIERR